MARKGLEVSVEGRVTGTYRDDLPLIWENVLWEKYLESFGNLDTYQDQLCYNRKTFLDALRDPRYVKFVLSDGDWPRGMAMATNDMERARTAYINMEYVRKRYPREVEEGRFYYVTSIFIDPDCQSMGYVKSLLRAMLAFMKEGGRVAGFDFCESKEFLAGLIENLSRDSEVDIPVHSRRMDAQAYYFLELEESSLDDVDISETLAELP